MSACIVGWHHLKFGKHEHSDIEELIVEAAIGALAHAEIEPKDVDAIFLGTFNSGFVQQDFPSSLVLQAGLKRKSSPACNTNELGKSCCTNPL